MEINIYIPTKLYWQGDKVSKLKAEGLEGHFTLLPAHIDYISVLVPGILILNQGKKELILNPPWPAYDASAMVEEEILMVIQVNGKLRSRITVPVNSSNEEVEKIALSDEKTQGWIAGKEIKKVIVVPKKLVNVVVR